jgi:hypothetical protein
MRRLLFILVLFFIPLVAQAQTRNWWQVPGQDNTFYVTPFYTTAQWDCNSSSASNIRNGSGGGPTASFTTNGNYAYSNYVGNSTDPLVTVTDGTRTIHVNMPLGATIDPQEFAIGGTSQSTPYVFWFAK